MTEEGSVWDTGPQYPDVWPEQADGTSSPAEHAPSHDAPRDTSQDTTPTAGSPVDFDTPIPAPAPVVPSTAPPPNRGSEPPGWWRRTLIGFPVWILFAFLAIVAVIFVVIVRAGDPGVSSADRVQTPDVATTVPSQVLTTTIAPPSTVGPPSTAPVPTTEPPIFTRPDAPTPVPPTVPATAPLTSPATQPPLTQPPATQPPATRPPATTLAPATTPPPATLPPDGPVVTIIGSVGPCNYGSQCLLAGFALHNFNSQPSEFVCEFGDGSRYAFHFTRQEVERACATGNTNGSITIEVDGVRSATFTRP